MDRNKYLETEVHKQMNMAYLGNITTKEMNMDKPYDEKEFLELHQTLNTLQKQMRSCFAKDLAPMGEFAECAIIDILETYIHANDRKFHRIAWKYICKQVMASMLTIVPEDKGMAIK